MNPFTSGCSYMRVLVADSQFEQRVVVEKSLSLLGYFRVCPVATFRELIMLSHYSPNTYDRFDLLIVNAQLVAEAGLSATEFLVNNSRFRHILIYDGGCAQRQSKSLSNKPNHQVRLVNSFSFETLLDFVSLIDQDLRQRKMQSSVKVA